MRAGFQRPPLSSMPVEYLTPAIEDRAVELLTLLADRGQHRAPSIPDLIIAATAELAGLTVLHLDKDFDLIAEITAQPMQRLNMDSAAETGSDAGQAEALSFPIAAMPVVRCLTAETFACQESLGSHSMCVPLEMAAVASGAGGARTHDRPIMRSTASCTIRASCTDDTNHCTDGTHRAGIIWRAGPRTGPRPKRPSPLVLLLCVHRQSTQPTSARSGHDRWTITSMISGLTGRRTRVSMRPRGTAARRTCAVPARP